MNEVAEFLRKMINLTKLLSENAKIVAVSENDETIELTDVAALRQIAEKIKIIPGLQYRPYDFDDWGMIRDMNGRLFAVVRRILSKEEEDKFREKGADPYEEIARRLIDMYSGL